MDLLAELDGKATMAGIDVAALVGSRICHDLISPLGAIGNGVELIEMSGAGGGAEMALIADSIINANAKVRFFRLAFGKASPGAEVARSEVAELLSSAARGGRIAYYWAVEGKLPRDEIRAVFLALMCLETAMPRGGDLQVHRNGDTWEIVAEGETVNCKPELWDPLLAGQAPADVTAAQVQFALLPEALIPLGRIVTLELGKGRAVLRL